MATLFLNITNLKARYTEAFPVDYILVHIFILTYLSKYLYLLNTSYILPKHIDYFPKLPYYLLLILLVNNTKKNYVIQRQIRPNAKLKKLDNIRQNQCLTIQFCFSTSRTMQNVRVKVIAEKRGIVSQKNQDIFPEKH